MTDVVSKFMRYADLLYRIALRFTGNSRDATRLVHNTLYAAVTFERAEGHIAQPKMWLQTYMRQRFVMHPPNAD